MGLPASARVFSGKLTDALSRKQSLHPLHFPSFSNQQGTLLDSPIYLSYAGMVSVIDQIKTLSPTEAVVAMEALWEQLRNGGSEIEFPDWHREELERRDAMVQEGKAEFSPWNEAKERIRKRVRK